MPDFVPPLAFGTHMWCPSVLALDGSGNMSDEPNLLGAIENFVAEAAPNGNKRPVPLLLLHALGQGRQLDELLAICLGKEQAVQLRSRCLGALATRGSCAFP